jgi:hypothetical protein
MISEPYVWRERIIDRHGADALGVAAQRATRLFMNNDLDGVASWRRILNAIRELQRMRLKVGERLN